MSDDTIEVLVEIRDERAASFGVAGCDGSFRLSGKPQPLIWLPKAEIRLIHRQADGCAVVEIPRWLAEKEGLTDAVHQPDPNQGSLL